MVFFTGSILIFLLSITVGLILNGAFFNPFIAPIVTLIVFFWKNWKFSVEARCLQLKTLIIEVCEDKMETTGTDETLIIEVCEDKMETTGTDETLIIEVCEDKMETTGTDESNAISNNEPKSSKWDFLFWWRHSCIEASRCSDSNKGQENGKNDENNYNGDKLLAIKFEEKLRGFRDYGERSALSAIVAILLVLLTIYADHHTARRPR
ncbi:uncharacterized protein LOC114523897 [Dendronephthya gigantea]|uniref:uncharacterized protein LOC114523897 n=1 Tax=Dendronephthya gigantea TaxID=151771 RepID=UPI00106BE25D|nr:uncharacterized protein LOC114523897 [Dendronephthya gigantea]